MLVLMLVLRMMVKILIRIFVMFLLRNLMRNWRIWVICCWYGVLCLIIWIVCV